MADYETHFSQIKHAVLLTAEQMPLYHALDKLLAWMGSFGQFEALDSDAMPISPNIDRSKPAEDKLVDLTIWLDSVDVEDNKLYDRESLADTIEEISQVSRSASPEVKEKIFKIIHDYLDNGSPPSEVRMNPRCVEPYRGEPHQRLDISVRYSQEEDPNLATHVLSLLVLMDVEKKGCRYTLSYDCSEVNEDGFGSASIVLHDTEIDEIALVNGSANNIMREESKDTAYSQKGRYQAAVRTLLTSGEERDTDYASRRLHEVQHMIDIGPNQSHEDGAVTVKGDIYDLRQAKSLIEALYCFRNDSQAFNIMAPHNFSTTPGQRARLTPRVLTDLGRAFMDNYLPKNSRTALLRESVRLKILKAGGNPERFLIDLGVQVIGMQANVIKPCIHLSPPSRTGECTGHIAFKQVDPAHLAFQLQTMMLFTEKTDFSEIATTAKYKNDIGMAMHMPGSFVICHRHGYRVFDDDEQLHIALAAKARMEGLTEETPEPGVRPNF